MAKPRRPSMRTGLFASLGTLFTSAAVAFSQVPSGYYPPTAAAPNYGNYAAYPAAPGYGYGYSAGYPYPAGYGYTYTNAVPVVTQPAATPSQPTAKSSQPGATLSQPMPAGKSAAES